MCHKGMILYFHAGFADQGLTLTMKKILKSIAKAILTRFLVEVGVGRQVLIVQDLDQDLGQGESGQDLDLTRQGDHPQEDHRLDAKWWR